MNPKALHKISYGMYVVSSKAGDKINGQMTNSDFDIFHGVEHRNGKTGVPVVTENSVAYAESKFVDTSGVGTHILYICEVVDTDTLNEGEVMTYEYYHGVKGGTLSEKASHHIKEKNDPKEVNK